MSGDRYFFVSDDLAVGYCTVTDDVYSDAYDRQTARRMAGNFFQTWEEAKEMADKHLANAIKMIEDGRLNRKWALPFLKGEQKRRKRQAFIDNFFDNLLKGAQESAEEPLPIVNGTLHN